MSGRRLRSTHWFGSFDKDGFIHRSWMKNQGVPQDLLDGRPVSYTHLDVYKRQVAGDISARLADARPQNRDRPFGRLQQRDRRQRHLRAPREAAQMRDDMRRSRHPVSYTHLDVYKRQGLLDLADAPLARAGEFAGLMDEQVGLPKGAWHRSAVDGDE